MEFLNNGNDNAMKHLYDNKNCSETDKNKGFRSYANKNKKIHDVLYGYIEITPLMSRIIDTPEFQRLHYIKQCGLLYKVFPTTKHSRFEHSIGVYHCTNLLLASLERNSVEPLHVDQHTKELISIAGLCHDLGHGPFSHLYDLHLENNDISLQISKTHEERSCDIFRRIVDKYELKIRWHHENIKSNIADIFHMHSDSLRKFEKYFKENI